MAYIGDRHEEKILKVVLLPGPPTGCGRSINVGLTPRDFAKQIVHQTTANSHRPPVNYLSGGTSPSSATLLAAHLARAASIRGC